MFSSWFPSPLRTLVGAPQTTQAMQTTQTTQTTQAQEEATMLHNLYTPTRNDCQQYLLQLFTWTTLREWLLQSVNGADQWYIYNTVKISAVPDAQLSPAFNMTRETSFDFWFIINGIKVSTACMDATVPRSYRDEALAQNLISMDQLLMFFNSQHSSHGHPIASLIVGNLEILPLFVRRGILPDRLDLRPCTTPRSLTPHECAWIATSRTLAVPTALLNESVPGGEMMQAHIFACTSSNLQILDIRGVLSCDNPMLIYMLGAVVKASPHLQELHAVMEIDDGPVEAFVESVSTHQALIAVALGLRHNAVHRHHPAAENVVTGSFISILNGRNNIQMLHLTVDSSNLVNLANPMVFHEVYRSVRDNRTIRQIKVKCGRGQTSYDLCQCIDNWRTDILPLLEYNWYSDCALEVAKGAWEVRSLGLFSRVFACRPVNRNPALLFSLVQGCSQQIGLHNRNNR